MRARTTSTSGGSGWQPDLVSHSGGPRTVQRRDRRRTRALRRSVASAEITTDRIDQGGSPDRRVDRGYRPCARAVRHADRYRRMACRSCGRSRRPPFDDPLVPIEQRLSMHCCCLRLRDPTRRRDDGRHRKNSSPGVARRRSRCSPASAPACGQVISDLGSAPVPGFFARRRRGHELAGNIKSIRRSRSSSARSTWTLATMRFHRCSSLPTEGMTAQSPWASSGALGGRNRLASQRITRSLSGRLSARRPSCLRSCVGSRVSPATEASWSAGPKVMRPTRSISPS